MKNTFLFTLAFILSIGFFACDDDDILVPTNEDKFITTLTLTFSPEGGGDHKTFSFRDTDGPDGEQPTISADSLDQNTVYNVSIVVLNESRDPVEDITEKIREENKEHQFFFDITGGVSLTYAYADVDEDGNPVGLQTEFSAGLASQGIMTVILRHKPDKNAPGVSDGNIILAGGETDIEVTFNVIILQ
jgi:hypothetical protein